MALPLVLMKKLLLDAAIRAAKDPRVQAKALDLAQQALPHVKKAALTAADIARAQSRAAGDALRNLRKRGGG